MIRYLNLIFLTNYLFAINGSISGNVSDGLKPLAGANVYLSGTDAGTMTDSLGNYFIGNLNVGKYKLIVNYIGYEKASKEVYISEKNLSSDQTNEISFSRKLNLIGTESEIQELLKAKNHVDINFKLKVSTLGLDEIVVSASKVEQKITEAPSVIAVVNEQNIRRRVGVTDFNRLASMAKGVDVSYFGSQGAQINARGFDGAYNTRFRQFTDGIYLGDAVTGQVFSVFSGPPKESISRIEVLFGPQAALYGPDASQGLLNIITKHPLQNKINELNFSISSFNDPRLGGRFVKNYDKISVDLSGEIKSTKEIPYNNNQKEIFWLLGDTLYLTDDLFSSMAINKIYFRSHVYYRLKKDNEISGFYNRAKGQGYSMGSFGPNYNPDFSIHQYGLKFTNKSHFLRLTINDQNGKMAPLSGMVQSQVYHRDPETNESLPWQDVVKNLEDYGLSWWLQLHSDDFYLDYQYNNKFKNNLSLVFGFDYEFKDPNTNRSMINDRGLSPITGEEGGSDIKEYRYGTYMQIEYPISDLYSINSSLRYDNHEFYNQTISPRFSLVRKNFFNGNLKLITGTGFKAPTLHERNVHAGIRNAANGSAGDVDPVTGEVYPYDWTINVTGLGYYDGFTVVDFKDTDNNGIYNEGDLLLNREYIEPLKLEEARSFELSYTGIFQGKNLVEINAYRSRHINYKGPLTGYAVTGPAWNYMAQSIPGPLPLDAMRQVNYGDNLISNDPIPQFSYFLTYPNLPIDILFFGFESGFKHVNNTHEFSFNFSYFNDQNLIDKRDKAKRYVSYMNSPNDNNSLDSTLQKFYPYIKLYSNTPNFKGTVSITEYNTFMKNLSSSLVLKGTSSYDFVSGYFEATKEGKGQIPATAAGQSFFRNPGQLGGQIYADLNFIYEFNENIHAGFSIKNLLGSDALALPLAPKIPRHFSFETGYSFK